MPQPFSLSSCVRERHTAIIIRTLRLVTARGLLQVLTEVVEGAVVRGFVVDSFPKVKLRLLQLQQGAQVVMGDSIVWSQAGGTELN